MTPRPPPNPFIAQAGLLSLIAPCFGIVVYLGGRRAFSDNPNGMLVAATVCLLLAAAGFIFGAVAFFAQKVEKSGIMGQSIAGIVINGLLIGFAIFSTPRQNVAASESKTPDPPHKGSSYISGK